MPLFVGASESYDTDAWEAYNLKKENAKLREERDHWHVEQVHAYGNWEDAHKRAAELESENTKLQENLESARKTMADELEKQVSDYRARHIEQAGVIADLESENAKLCELASGMYALLETLDKVLGNHDLCETPRPLIFGDDKSFKDVMNELEVRAK